MLSLPINNPDEVEDRYDGNTASWEGLRSDDSPIRVGWFPPHLRQRCEAGEVVLLIGRNSGESGYAALEAAINNLISSASSLVGKGLDVRALIPSAKVLMARFLREARPVASKEQISGASFLNRFLLIRDFEHLGVVFLISAGPAGKKDERGEVVFVRETATIVEELRPCVVYMHTMDRLMRSNWGLAPLMNTVQNLRDHASHLVYFSDARWTAFRAIEHDIEDIMFFVEGTGHAAVARDLPFKTRSGMIIRTQDEMTNGRALFAFPHNLPNGLTVQVLLAGPRLSLERYVVIDTPRCRFDCPDGDEVKTYDGKGDLQKAWARPNVIEGPPLLLTDDGHPVDNAASVTWALAHIGLPGYSHRRIHDELVARQFSTFGRLRFSGPDGMSLAALAPGQDGASVVVRRILARLDFYESGVLRLKVGVSGLQKFKEISGCFPPWGYWGKAHDFERIRAYMERGQRRRRRTQLQLDWVPVQLGDHAGVLRPSGGSMRLQGSLNRLTAEQGVEMAWQDGETPVVIDHAAGLRALGRLMGRTEALR